MGDKMRNKAGRIIKSTMVILLELLIFDEKDFKSHRCVKSTA